MSNIETQIEEVLAGHEAWYPALAREETHCDCGQWKDDSCMQNEKHRAHVAAMLAPIIREAGAAALLAAAGDVFDTAIPAEIARWLEARAKAITNPILSPECDNQYHQACDYRAFDPDLDEAVQCQCACHP